MSVSLSTEKKLTPMMEQYRSIQRTLPSDTILFFRLGDFYEMFFEDAIKASEILEITLTGRGGGESGRIPMCGIPYHASGAYIRTLIDANLKVAICEQVGDPKASKGLVERRVKRIISPATYLEDESTRKQHDYMVSVVRRLDKKKEKHSYALSYLEMSTGEFCVREVSEDRVRSELTLLGPREVILARSISEETEFHRFSKDQLKATVTVYEDWIFEREEAIQLLKDNFHLASDKGISFCENTLAISACGAILYYLRDHLHEALSHIQLPTLIQENDFMILDQQTQKSLELVVTQLGKKGTPSAPTLLTCLDRTLTSMGARTLYAWLTHPLLEKEKIETRQEAVKELIVKPELHENLCEQLSGIKDMERTLTRLNYGVANARDLINLKIFLMRIPSLQASLASASTSLIHDLSENLDAFPHIIELVDKAITEEPPLSVKDGGLILDGYHAELDELRGISKNGKNWLLDFEKKEIERTGIKALKIKYSQVFGYTIEVRKGSLSSVPENYIRRQTLANAERFVVPELKEWDEKISGAQDKIKALEYQIFSQIRTEILRDLLALQKMARAVGQLDALYSLALVASQSGWILPEVTDSLELEIEKGRHPVVESMLAQNQFVENGSLLDGQENQLIVLTGPNMAGKSTYIRQVGLIVLLAQMGSFVPAARAKIGISDRIFTRIGASDNLAQGESTFMIEMLETAHILQSATKKSLLILDEVGRGTSTFDGVSIAWSICEYLAQGKVNPRTLFATHYHELTQLEEHFSNIKNYTISVRETGEDIIFMRKVVRGKADRSYGIHVAKLAGIPEKVTQRANEILTVLENENQEATLIIESKEKKKSPKTSETKDQLTFFDMPSSEHPLLEKIRQTSPDEMTPLEALKVIAEWKKMLEEDS